MLQNAIPRRKSAPGPPNSSDEHVSCAVPATENAFLQILCICPTPAIVFETATKPSRFAHFWQDAQSPSPATQNGIWTSKSAPYPFRFFHVWLRNVLRATTACTFSTSQLPKVLWTRQFFLHFWLLNVGAKQPHALFRHRNFQKYSEPVSFLHFWLRNVLCATTACTFSTSQLLKVLRCWCVLHILTWKCASRHNGVQLFISHLTTWLRTRRFSEPTFRPSGATNHWKNTMFRDFPAFLRTWIFFLLRLSLLWSSFFFSSLLFSDSSHLCFSSVHIVGSLTCKLPSILIGVFNYGTMFRRVLTRMFRPTQLQAPTLYPLSPECITIIVRCWQRFSLKVDEFLKSTPP